MTKIISLLNKEIKQARSDLKKEKQECSIFGHYDDCGEFYRENVIRAETKLSTLIVLRGKIKKEI